MNVIGVFEAYALGRLILTALLIAAVFYCARQFSRAWKSEKRQSEQDDVDLFGLNQDGYGPDGFNLEQRDREGRDRRGRREDDGPKAS